MTDWIWIIISLAITAAGVLWRRAAAARLATADAPQKSQKRMKKLAAMTAVLGAYLLVTRLIGMVFGAREHEEIAFSVWADRTELFGLSVSNSAIYSWIIIAALAVLALILRFTVLRNFKDVPRGAQNVLETAMEAISNYVDKNAHGAGDVLASYIFTVGMFLAGCACVEMLGLRTPASDITVTLALGLITFFLINWYGIKKKGVLGRVKSMSGSNPAVFVLKIFTELAVPISMACRLFGNMLAGFVIMDLLYVALGAYAVGISSVIGLYFGVAHPLLQIFIFVTLTLTFISEAIE